MMRRRSRKREAAARDRPEIRCVPEPDERSARVGAEDPGLQEFVRRLPCVVCLAPTLGGDPCHRRARRRFGDWVEDDLDVIGNLFPACREHHREQHERGLITFEDAHDLDLKLICTIVGRAYLGGWSATGLGSVVRHDRGYDLVDVDEVIDGGVPY